MTTAAHVHHPGVPERLLDHCAILDLNDLRPTAGERLERVIGRDLARLLRVALLGEYRSGWRSLGD